MDQKPSIGRIVLFQADGTTYPAIVVKVRDPNAAGGAKLLDLHVFGDHAKSLLAHAMKGGS